MGILLDTHVLLWWLADDKRLGKEARRLIADPSDTIFVSAATAWEIVIKQALGKLKFEGDLLDAQVDAQGFERLPVHFKHAAAVGDLPPIHRDPFDRMLIAQARMENLRLLTADPDILGYPVNVLKA